MDGYPVDSGHRKNPGRFVDYFFQAGLGNVTDLLDRRLPVKCDTDGSQVDLSVIEVLSSSREMAGNGRPSRCDTNKTLEPNGIDGKQVHPLKYHFQAETMQRYPKQDWSDTEKFPAYVPMVITEENGEKCYGTCIIIYEKPAIELRTQLEELISIWRNNNLAESDMEYVEHVQSQLAFHKEKLLKLHNASDDGVSSEERHELAALEEEKVAIYEELLTPLKQTILANMDHVYVPRCLGLLSHWPWYSLFKDWLCELVRMIRDPNGSKAYAPLERCIVNIIHEIPLPPPGKLEIVVNIVFELVLTERKIIFLSSHYSMLNLASETFCHLLFPLSWHHILIPVLPSRLISYLQAPMPYIVGVHRKYFGKSVEDEWRPPDASVIDLDNNNIDLSHPVVGLPSRERRKLISRLEKSTSSFPAQSNLRYTPEIPSSEIFPRKIPLSMQYAYPNNQQVVLTADSQIGSRRIQDIPKSMYTKYSNEFLQAKCNPPQRSNTSPIRNRAGLLYSQTQSQLLHNQSIAIGASQSFSNLTSNPSIPHHSYGVSSSFNVLSGDNTSPPAVDGWQKGSPPRISISNVVGRFSRNANERESVGASDLSRSSNGSISAFKQSVYSSAPHSTDLHSVEDGETTQSLENSSECIPYTASVALQPPPQPQSQPLLISIPSDSQHLGRVALPISSSTTSSQPTSGITDVTDYVIDWHLQRMSSDENKLSGLESLFGGFSSMSSSSSRTRLRPASAGPEILRPPSSSVDSDFSLKTPMGSRGYVLGASSVSPKKNLLARFWSGHSSTLEAPESTSVYTDGCTNATSPSLAVPTPTPRVTLYSNNISSSRSLPLNLKSDTDSPIDSPLSLHADSLDESPIHQRCAFPQPSNMNAHSPAGVMFKDGHIFHELIPVVSAPQIPSILPALDRIADIEASDTGSDAASGATSQLDGDQSSNGAQKSEIVDEFADRFGQNSQSSEDYTQSEMSTDIRTPSGRFGIGTRRVGGGSISGSGIGHSTSFGNSDPYDRRQSGVGSTTLLSRRETVRSSEVPVCRTCRKDLNLKLQKILMCENSHPCSVVFREEKVRGSFFKVFTSLLKTYRNHLGSIYKPETVTSRTRMSINMPNRSTNGRAGAVGSDGTPMETGSEDWFRKQEFLSDFDSETRVLMAQVIETQAFAQFVLDRVERPESDYEILFFDESIKAKLNRSKLKFTKATTPFLRDTAYQITSSFQTLAPNIDDVPPDYRPLEDDLFKWNEQMLVAPRPIEPLLSDLDSRMMQSHTNELVQRARLESSMKRKQDFYKWMKIKMKYFQKIGGGEVVSIGFATDDQRRELLEERLAEVSSVIAEYEQADLSYQTLSQVKHALDVLHSQNKILVRAADEEQLVESSDEDELQLILSRLIRLITIHEDHQSHMEKQQDRQLSVSAGGNPDTDHYKLFLQDPSHVLTDDGAPVTSEMGAMTREAAHVRSISTRVVEWAADIMSATASPQINTGSPKRTVGIASTNSAATTVGALSVTVEAPPVDIVPATSPLTQSVLLRPPTRPPPMIPSASSSKLDLSVLTTSPHANPLPYLPKDPHYGSEHLVAPHLLRHGMTATTQDSFASDT
ncbi:hypothetical protein BSLG_001428 [Batrachochytrium salamandrivorans]|nr:hypothetical protein BSLG_001428 [Batrachochytrium salamandrivorans]